MIFAIVNTACTLQRQPVLTRTPPAQASFCKSQVICGLPAKHHVHVGRPRRPKAAQRVPLPDLSRNAIVIINNATVLNAGHKNFDRQTGFYCPTQRVASVDGCVIDRV